MDKVCFTCHYYDASEETCRLDNFEIESPIPDALLTLFDMGEMLEMLEGHISNEEKRLELESDIHRLVSNTFEDLENPKIKILNPRGFGCNKWL